MKQNYIKQVHLVLQALKNMNLRIKLKKSIFHFKKVQFLRFMIISEGLQMNLKEIRFITE